MADLQSNEKEIFTRHYASLCNTLTDVDHLLPYFVQENIINTNDVESLDATTTANKVKKLLSRISGPLVVGDTKGFHVMLNIMKEHGNLGTKDLAVKISRELPSTISEIEDDVGTRSEQSSDTSHQASSPDRTTGSREQSIVRTAAPYSTQFSTFVAAIEALLDKKCQDKLEQSKRFCSNLTISDNSNELLFNDEQLQEIKASTTFSELFVILRKHWSWKDYSILTHIISITGLKEAKDEAELFEKRMASYQGMKIISENISADDISHDYIRLSIIIDKPYRELSLQNFTELHKYIFSKLDVKRYIALPFIKFLFRSLHLEWYVLKRAAPHIIKMAKLNEEVFVRNSVVFIQVDQFVVLDCKAEVDDKTQIDLMGDIQKQVYDQPVDDKVDDDEYLAKLAIFEEITNKKLIPQGIVTKWDEFASELGFDHGDISVIQENACQLDVQKCSQRVLLRWWAECPNPIVTKLIIALHGIDQHRDADQLEKDSKKPGFTFDDRFLRRYAIKVASQWDHLGTQLGVNNMDNIQHINNPTQHKFDEMLQAWLAKQTCTKQEMYKKIYDAMRNMDRNRDAEYFKEKAGIVDIL